MALVIKNPPADTGDARVAGLIPGLGGRLPRRSQWQPLDLKLHLSHLSHGPVCIDQPRAWHTADVSICQMNAQMNELSHVP